MQPRSISRRNDDEPLLKVEIPRSLYQAIIRIQAAEDLDFREACLSAAHLVDPRRDEYDEAVRDEADRLAKSRFFKQLNKARRKIGDKEYSKGFNDGYEAGSELFKYPCSVCSEPIVLSDKSWESAKEFLVKEGWGHSKCHENKT